MSDINLSGFLFNASGAAVSGATVEAFAKNTVTETGGTPVTGGSTTTNSSGYYSMSLSSDNEHDIRITSGNSVRWRRFDDRLQMEELEVSVLNIREGATAQVYTIAPGSISADRTLTLPAATGNDTLASLGLAQTFSANQTFTGTVTVGSDGSGTDVIFYSGTAGDNLTWDASEEVLNITGTNGATALDVLDGDVRIVDKLYFYDRGCEYISGDGSTLTITGNAVVSGTLTVNGTTTTVNSTTVTVDDPIITLGGDTAPGSDDNKDRGVEFRYHDGSCARVGFFGYDDSASVFTGLTAATNSSEVFSGTVMNAKFGSMNLGTVAAAGSDTDKFLVLDSCGNVDYRTGTQVLSDIGGSGGSTVTVTDNESTDENNLVAFVADAATSTGSHGLEMDGNFNYNPSTGLVTATGFSGNLTGTLQTAAQGNVTSLGTLTALTVDCVAVNGKVVTMTGSACDTVVMTAATNGAFSLVTTDNAAAAANIQITADGTVDIDSAGVLTLDSGAAINIEPASGSAVLIDGTVSIDGAAITGATSILATDIKIGEDDETKVDFACANIINLHANNIKALSVHNTSSKGELRFYEGANYVGFAAPALSADQVWALPTADGSCGQSLTTNGSGALSWASGGVGCGPLRIANGAACAPAYSFSGDTNTGLYHTGTCDVLELIAGGGGALRLDSDSKVYIKDTQNCDMGRGLTINQGGYDNSILSLKSSDISHPLVSTMTDGGTNYGEADDYVTMRKKYGARGGVRFDVFDDGGQAGDDGHVEWWIWYNVDASTVHGTAGRGITNFLGRKFGGACSHVAATTANTNQFVVNVSTGLGASQAKFIVDAEGDLFADGTLSAYDSYCDAQLVRTMSNVLSDSVGAGEPTIENKWDDFISYNEQTLIDAGLLGGPRVGRDPNVYDCQPREGQGVGLINYTGMVRLHNGAIWQLHSKLNDQAEELTALKGQLTALTEGK